MTPTRDSDTTGSAAAHSRRPPPAADAAARLRATVWGVAVLLGVLGAMSAVSLVLGRGRPGWAAAVGFAAAIVGVSSIGGWILGRFASRTPAGGVAAALAASTARIALPLAALAWLAARNPSLGESPEAGLLVVFYLVLLATTLLATMMEARAGRGKTGPD
jgi:hypothetical protein